MPIQAGLCSQALLCTFCVSSLHCIVCEDLDLFVLACKLVVGWMVNLVGGIAVEQPHLIGRDTQGSIYILWLILITQKQAQ